MKKMPQTTNFPAGSLGERISLMPAEQRDNFLVAIAQDFAVSAAYEGISIHPEEILISLEPLKRALSPLYSRSNL